MAKNEVTQLKGLKRSDAITPKHTSVQKDSAHSRTTVYLSKDVVRWFKQNALDTGVSMSDQIENFAREHMAKKARAEMDKD
jgi:predicted transposase YbfD/YdcC